MAGPPGALERPWCAPLPSSAALSWLVPQSWIPVCLETQVCWDIHSIICRATSCRLKQDLSSGWQWAKELRRRGVLRSTLECYSGSSELGFTDELYLHENEVESEFCTHTQYRSLFRKTLILPLCFSSILLPSFFPVVAVPKRHLGRKHFLLHTRH